MATNSYNYESGERIQQTQADFPESLRLILLLAAVAVFGIVIGSAVRGGVDLVVTLFLVVALPLTVLILRQRSIVISIMCAIIYLNISDTLQSYYGLPSVNKLMIPAILLMLIWFTISERGQRPAVIVAFILGAIYFVYVATSLLHAQNIELVSESLNRIWKDIAVMLVIAGLLWDERDVRFVSIILIIAGAFISVVSMIAYYKADPYFDAGGLIRWMQADRDGTAPSLRISGPVADPNFFAQTLLIPMAMAMCFAINAKHYWARALYTIGLILILCGIGTTLSRGGFLAALATFGVFWIWGLRSWTSRSLTAGALLIAMIAGFLLAPSGVQIRIIELADVLISLVDDYQQPDQSSSGRLDEMLAAFYMFLDHPLFGVGISNYSVHFQDYSLEHGLMVRGSDRAAHSLYLEIMAEQGIFGLAIFFIVLFVSFRVAIGAMKRQKLAGNELARNVIFAVILAYCAYLLAAVLLHGVHQRYFWMLTGLVLATGNFRSGISNVRD